MPTTFNEYKNSIVLQVDEAKREIVNNGTKEPVILGVKGDNCAEKVYFEIPTILSPVINLSENTDTVKTTVYINYKDAGTNTHIHECGSAGVNGDTAIFTWIITENATEFKGDVKFSICVKREEKDPVTGVFKLTNEWHTIPFTGKILDNIHVTNRTPEEITHESVTMNALIAQVADYTTAVDGYTENLAVLNERIKDTQSFVEDEVAAKLPGEVTKQMDGNYLPLTGGVLNGRVIIENSGTTEFVYVGENKIMHGTSGNSWTHTFPSESGELVSKNESGFIETAGGGIAYRGSATEAGAVGGFAVSLTGEPVIISDDLSLCFNTTEDLFLIPRTYHFPDKDGTVALTSDLTNFANKKVIIQKYSPETPIILPTQDINDETVIGKPILKKTLSYPSGLPEIKNGDVCKIYLTNDNSDPVGIISVDLHSSGLAYDGSSYRALGKGYMPMIRFNDDKTEYCYVQIIADIECKSGSFTCYLYRYVHNKTENMHCYDGLIVSDIIIERSN